jgi:DNA gyrase inhibitor GyrI
MSDLMVRVEKLEPMRIASVRVISETPERDAWDKLRAWAGAKGLLDHIDQHPVFGFNHPSPSPKQKAYGYEFWLRVDRDFKSEGEIEVKDFAGGLYAVATCKLQEDPLGSVGEVWRKLWNWAQTGDYKWRRTHELEKPHHPQASEEDMVLDLYLPIEERAKPPA